MDCGQITVTGAYIWILMLCLEAKFRHIDHSSSTVIYRGNLILLLLLPFYQMEQSSPHGRVQESTLSLPSSDGKIYLISVRCRFRFVFASILTLIVVQKYWINQGAPNVDFWGHEVGGSRSAMNVS